MKRFVSAALCVLMMISTAPSALAAQYEAKNLSKGVIGTLNTSGASYEAKVKIPGYIGQLELEADIDGETENISITVIESETPATISVTLNRFDGYAYEASQQCEEYIYKQGHGFETADKKVGSGTSNQKGGSLMLGKASGLYSGRVYFYYSMEKLKYKNIDEIPDDKWTDLYWFNLGTSYVLSMTKNDIKSFMETGEFMGYTWPGLRMMLSGEQDMAIYTDGSFENFKPQNEYKEGQFSDVSAQWFKNYVAVSYEYNMMKGNANGSFTPNGNITVAEAITIAARMHNIFYGKDGVFEQGTPWYDVYVGYAIERGIIKDDTFDDYERNITRKEMAALLGAAVDLTDIERINAIASIPDVKRDDADFACILALYNAGVLTGSEEDGSFLPEDDITRAEVAAMVARLVKAELRVKKA